MRSVKTTPSRNIPALQAGFSLVQMSVTMVIIGLIIGGILVGQNLIQAAAVNAQISQINKYQTATHLFETKYGYLPGDIPEPYATQFGFLTRGAFAGEGDGNGVLEGNCDNVAGANQPFYDGCGETATLWVDLTTANLTDNGISYKGVNYPNPTTPNSIAGSLTLSSVPSLFQWLPTAKIGSNNFVYVYSLNRLNYFAVSTVTKLGYTIQSISNPGLTVQQAYTIDSKIDDGLPQSGFVTACYYNSAVVANVNVWAAGSNQQGANGGNNCIATTTATPYATTNCYDNNNVAGTQTYSTAKNANALNCALSFQFQ